MDHGVNTRTPQETLATFVESIVFRAIGDHGLDRVDQSAAQTLNIFGPKSHPYHLLSYLLQSALGCRLSSSGTVLMPDNDCDKYDDDQLP